MNILAIETSCDETAAAVVTDAGAILSNIVASQIKDHAAFGGVVPEIASRRHAELIEPVVREALHGRDLSTGDLGAVAVTCGPGLVGALLVGISYAKALAYGLDIPLCGVNHLEGHLSAAQIGHEVSYPHIGMVVSGGHTSLYRVTSPSSITPIGQTLDDAAGEAFDKVAKLLYLGYPGGVVIERISQGVDSHAIEFPRPLMNERTYDFSFSGLKTAVLNRVLKEGIFEDMDLTFSGLPVRRPPGLARKTWCRRSPHPSSRLWWTFWWRSPSGPRHHHMDLLVVTGGVASNTLLRESLKRRSGNRNQAHHPGEEILYRQCRHDRNRRHPAHQRSRFASWISTPFPVDMGMRPNPLGQNF